MQPPSQGANQAAWRGLVQTWGMFNLETGSKEDERAEEHVGCACGVPFNSAESKRPGLALDRGLEE